MNKYKLLPILFSLVALIQLAVPLQMVLNSESVLQTGMIYKFKTRPIDPYDPFIGRYIVLDYEISRIPNLFNIEQSLDNTIFVYLDTDSDGFATIKDISRSNTKKGNYVKAKLGFHTESEIHIKFPFNRYYMREDLAKDAERLHERLASTGNHLTYALVGIKEGDAIVEGVYIDGISIEEQVKSGNETVE